MYNREEILKILNQAQKIDKKFEMFGSSTHKYVLNPPIQASFVRSIEVKYGFTLPEDYFRFITVRRRLFESICFGYDFCGIFFRLKSFYYYSGIF